MDFQGGKGASRGLNYRGNDFSLTGNSFHQGNTVIRIESGPIFCLFQGLLFESLYLFFNFCVGLFFHPVDKEDTI